MYNPEYVIFFINLCVSLIITICTIHRDYVILNEDIVVGIIFLFFMHVKPILVLCDNNFVSEYIATKINANLEIYISLFYN